MDSDVCDEGVGETVPAMEATKSYKRAEVILDRGQDQSSEGVRAASEKEVTRVNQDGGLAKGIQEGRKVMLGRMSETVSEVEDGMNKLINNKCENESLTSTVKDMVQRFQ